MTPKQIANRRAKVKAELAKGNYSGWSENETHHLTFHQLRDYCTGLLTISLGEGAFKTEVWNTMIRTISWHDYQVKKKALEVKYGLDKLPS